MPPKQNSPQQTPLYFVNGPIDFAFIGAISVLTFIGLRTFYGADRSPIIWMIGAQLSWFVNWPHFSATNYRLYHSKKNMNQYPVTSMVLPWLILAGTIASLWSPNHMAPYLVKMFLIWSPYHFSGQTLGITLVYARRAGLQFKTWERKALSTFIFGTFLMATIMSEVDPAGASMFGIKYPGFGLPAWTVDVARFLLYSSGALFLFAFLKRSFENKKLLPLIVLLPALTQYIWFVRSAGWASFQEFVPLFHSLQYLFIAWSMQLKTKADVHEGAKAKTAHRFIWSESFKWYLINIGGGALLFYFLPILASRSNGLDLSIATGIVLAGVQIHHFFVDGVIWKLKNPGVASPLMANFSQMLNNPRIVDKVAVG